MIYLFVILLFGFVKSGFLTDTHEEYIDVSISGSCHGLIPSCQNPNYKCRKFGTSELCVRNLNKDGDICNINKCPCCLGGFCLSTFKSDSSYTFRNDYLNYLPKLNGRRYLAKFSKEEAKKYVKCYNNIH